MAKLLYQGHGSFRLSTDNGTVIYVDPYAGDGYELPADIILVTHDHFDHNQINKPKKNSDCVVITNKDALKGKRHNSFDVKNVKIVAVTAQNKNHSPKNCVGYIIEFDGIKVYAAGDTSKTEQMQQFAELNLDYALLCCDGIYNMNATEASECAAIVKAKHSIPIHTKPRQLFDEEIAKNFVCDGKLVVLPEQEIELQQPRALPEQYNN